MPEPSQHPPDAPTVEVDGHDLVLTKNGQRFVFRYRAGQESQLLQTFAQMVVDPANDLSWFDAAVLSHQLGQQMGQRFQDMTRLKDTG